METKSQKNERSKNENPTIIFRKITTQIKVHNEIIEQNWYFFNKLRSKTYREIKKTISKSHTNNSGKAEFQTRTFTLC